MKMEYSIGWPTADTRMETAPEAEFGTNCQLVVANCQNDLSV
jgi:hypothetical protein